MAKKAHSCECLYLFILCACVCVRACVRVCVRSCVCVRACIRKDRAALDNPDDHPTSYSELQGP